MKKVMKDIFSKLTFSIMKNYVKLICDLPFLPEYIIQIRNLKQVLNHRLILKKVHKVIKFNQNAWLKAKKILS